MTQLFQGVDDVILGVTSAAGAGSRSWLASTGLELLSARQ